MNGNIKFFGWHPSMALCIPKAGVDNYPSFVLSLARPSASSAVAPFAAPVLPFSVTVALVSEESLRFSTVTVFSCVVTLRSGFLSGSHQTQHRTGQLVHADT